MTALLLIATVFVGSLEGRLATGPSETGYRVIYVKKDGPQRFWQLKVE